MKFLLGEKLKMTQIYDEDGNVVPVTLIGSELCKVTGKRTPKKHGYSAIQVGLFEEGGEDPATLKEFRVDEEELENYEKGDELDVSVFEEGDKISISGTSKGKGFQGVVKRHGFSGYPSSHGHGESRVPGAIGSAYPQRVFKGKKMAGRTGGERTTISNIEVVEVDPETNILAVKGGVPGNPHNIVELKQS